MRMGGQLQEPATFTSGNTSVTIVYVVGWGTEPNWKGGENVAHTGVRSPDRSARSESLYRLSDSRPLFPLQYLPLHQPVRKLQSTVQVWGWQSEKYENCVLFIWHRVNWYSTPMYLHDVTSRKVLASLTVPLCWGHLSQSVSSLICTSVSLASSRILVLTK
jgi:hypothetical protein